MSLRLGFQDAVTTCHNRPANEEGQCGEAVCGRSAHAMSCMMGGNRVTMHNEIADIICDFAEEAGVKARREVFVPEFCKTELKTPAAARHDGVWETGAVLDCLFYGTALVQDLLVDVTIKNAVGKAALKARTPPVPGGAAANGEREKQRRYPPAGGEACDDVRR